MRILSVEETRTAERRALEKGLNEDMLIENAAGALSEAAEELILERGSVTVFCGGGNNGSDGLSLARLLLLKGYRVSAVSVADKRNSFNAQRLRAFKESGGSVLSLEDALNRQLDKNTLIVDAMLGIGLNSALSGDIGRAAEFINGTGCEVLSVDVPTGLNADTGEAYPGAVRAGRTVTFSAYKRGQLIGDGKNYCGKIIVKNIGIPSEGLGAEYVGKIEIPERLPASHKGDYGKVKIIGGSPQMPGSCLLALKSADAALRSGAGLVTLCVPNSMREIFQVRVTEATLCFLPDKNGFITYDEKALRFALSDADSVAMGMGMGKNPALKEIIAGICGFFEGTLVLDADGLNAVAGDLDILKGHKCRLVITPHIGEYNRLVSGRPYAGADLFEGAKSLAKELGAVSVVKSAATIITDGEQSFICDTGTPAMAKGGSGDVLSGLVAALCKRLSPIKAACSACFIAGMAGRAAEKRLGSESVLAGDTAEEIAEIVRKMLS